MLYNCSAKFSLHLAGKVRIYVSKLQTPGLCLWVELVALQTDEPRERSEQVSLAFVPRAKTVVAEDLLAQHYLAKISVS